MRNCRDGARRYLIGTTRLFLQTRERELSALFEIGRKTGCGELLLITDHESAVEERDGMTVRIVAAPEWLVQ